MVEKLFPEVSKNPVKAGRTLPAWGATVSELLLDEQGDDDGVGAGETPTEKKY